MEITQKCNNISPSVSFFDEHIKNTNDAKNLNGLKSKFLCNKLFRKSSECPMPNCFCFAQIKYIDEQTWAQISRQIFSFGPLKNLISPS